MSDDDLEITLGVLNAVHDNSHVTQRSMAGELGIALGLTNSYLKRCVKKGLIKVQQIPANRYAYYLTPQGFREKSRLTREYLTQGFQFFRIAREQCSEIYTACNQQGWRRIALHGLTDLAEIAVLCAKDHDVDLVCIVDSSSELDHYANIPVRSEILDASAFDAIVVTDLGSPQKAFDQLVFCLGSERVFAPPILRVSGEIASDKWGPSHD